MLYDIANTQGINVVVPVALIISPTPTDAPTSAVEVSSIAFMVNQLADVATTLIMEEMLLSPILTNRCWDEDQSPLHEKDYPQWTCLFWDDASGEITSFLWMSDIFLSRLVCTLKEVATTMSMSDLSFLQSLSEAEKIEFVSKVTPNMYRDAPLISLVTTNRGDILVGGSPWKEMVTWKMKCEAMELKCSTLQNDLAEV